MRTWLDYPAQLALWRTVPHRVVAPTGQTLEPRRYRKDWYVGITDIQAFRPGIKLTEEGKRCSYERKRHNLVAVGPTLPLCWIDQSWLRLLVGRS